jgi:formate transporter
MPGLTKLIGALIFPVGLLLVITSGADLYTGNTAVVTIAKNEKQATAAGLLHNW